MNSESGLRDHVLTTLQEKGVETAIQSIYRDLEYARSIIKRRGAHNKANEDEEEDNDEEESWAFIGSDEPDPDAMTTKLSSKGLGGTAQGRALGSQVMKTM
jgi:sterol 3beta-glucosyltransferase